MFDRKGLLTISKKGLSIDPEEVMLVLIEADAEDVREEDETIEVVTAPEEMEKIKGVLSEHGITCDTAEVTMLPDSTIPVKDKGTAEKILSLLNALEDHDDVQQVYANFDIPDEIIQQIDNM
jgi:transcriptional/translational regulatory protein YebC/TACO1